MGIIVVSAAGNENADACLGSPSSAPETITVGAVDKDTKIASFSNWGKCVDVFAPGVNILSTIPKNLTSTMSGTSMACPYISGIVTLLIDSYTGKIDVKKVTDHLILWATKNKITGDLKGSPNVLGFSLMPDIV
jgi:subtilisin family serine protease